MDIQPVQPEKPKRKVYPLAIVSLVLGFLSAASAWLSTLALYRSWAETLYSSLCWGGILGSFISLGLGIIAISHLRHGDKGEKGLSLAIIGLILVIWGILSEAIFWLNAIMHF
jgi:hypothetical protein